MPPARAAATRPPAYRESVTGKAATPAAGVLVAGRPGGLREDVMGRLHAVTPAVAGLDHPGQLTSMSPPAQAAGIVPRGAAVILIPEPFLPGLPARLRYRRRARTLTASYTSLARAAHELGAMRLIVCSSAFLYPDDRGRPHQVTSPVEPGPETVAAHAAERAADVFTALGGESVVLRLGWVFGGHDPITMRVLSTARKGWRLIDGDPDAWVSAVCAADAAAAIAAATGAPSGVYNISDGHPVTQAGINAVLAQAARPSSTLHPLYDPYWGDKGALFGASRLLADAAFAEHTGWRPTGPYLSHYLRDHLR